MKRNFTKILAALTLLVFMMPSMVAWGQGDYSTTYTSNCTLTAGTNGSTCGVIVNGTTYDGIKVGTGKAGGDMTVTVPSGAKYLHIHVAAWNGVTGLSLNITPNTNISPTSIALTANSGIANNSPFTFSGDANTTDYYKIITFTNALTEETTFTFTTSIAKRFVIWGVNSEQAGSAPTVATPTFTPASGTYTEAQNVTISCETENATIYYTTDGSTPDNTSTEYTGAISVAETTTIKAIAYVGESASNVASATYTILTPMTIAEVRAQGTGSVYTSGTVTSCVGTTGYIQDETAAICVYGTTLTAGDNITIQGTLNTYHGLLQISNPTINVVSSGNTIEPTVMTIEEINTDYAGDNAWQGLYVTIEEATVTGIDGSNTTIAQGSNTIVVRSIPTSVTYAVNDILTLNGNIGCYDVAQIANPQNVTVQTSGEPAILVEPTTVNVPCAAAEGTLTVTYQNIETELGAQILWYESDGSTAAEYDWVAADFNENGNVDYIIDANTGDARLAYMKVYGLSAGGDDVYSELITFSQGHYVADYATLPFSFDGGRADIEGTAGLTQEGLGTDYNSSPKLKFDSTGDWLILHFNEEPGILTFDIKGNSFSEGTFTVQTSEDGDTYTDLASYTELGNTQNEEFATLGENVRYIKWIYTEKVNGNVALGKIVLAKPATAPVITVEPLLVEAPAEETEGTLTVTCLNMGEGVELDVVFYEEGGETETTYDWITAEIDENNNVYYLINANEGEARTAYMKVYGLSDNAEAYSDLVTFSQEAYVAPVTGSKYVKVTSVDDFTDGQYLIVYEEDGLAFDGSLETLDAVGNTITVTINNNEIAVTEATSASEFTINTTEGTSTIKSASGYYIGRTASSNGMNSSASEAYTNTISLIEGNAVITSSGGPTLRYNDASNQNRFRYFASGQKAIQLYKKVEDTPTENYTLEIEGYGSSAGGYYLIASPVTVNPGDVEGMTEGSFDLYSFNQSAENEWENWKDQNTEHYHFDLVPGKGYLYAHQIGGTFTLTGTPYNGNGEITLTYDANANLAGWNLIGNPFGVTATVDHDYYIMNENGDNFMLTSKETPIDAMQGIFIVTESADDNKAVFTTEEPAAPGEKLVLNVTHNRGVVDRAMIRFGEGQQMPKAMMSPNNTKIYIEQANNDYAVVRSDNESEMPISFKAADNGTYTLSIDADNVEMDYLHLVDNMTGMDVDLLANPSYTFEANTTDYACRFKLVYKNTTGIEESGEHFAYFNGSEWVINNEGDAQLHVIDMTGRIVSNETLNGNATVKVNAAPGVYMLRLVNGNDIKTQKVIIK